MDIQEPLKRLLAKAQGSTGQSKVCADYLLAWWNAADNGGFDLTDLWALDEDIAADCIAVFAWVAQNKDYPDDIGFGPEFERLWRQWRA